MNPSTVKKTQNAFRAHLEDEVGLSEWSAIRYTTVAGHLIGYCAERGLSLEHGAVPPSLLGDFTAQADDSRTNRRAATLYCEFLRARGAPLPEFDLDPNAVTLEQASEFFTAVAAELHEPYATLLHLLPLSGRRVEELRSLELGDVIETGGHLELRCGESLVQLHPPGAQLLHAYLHGWRARQSASGLASDLLFPGRAGERVGSSTITDKIKRCQRAAGLHDFRATMLSDLYALYDEEQGQGPEHEELPSPDLGDGLDGLPPAAIDDEGDPHAAADEHHPIPSTHDPNPTDEHEDPMANQNNGQGRAREAAQRGLAAEIRKLIPSGGRLHIQRRRDDANLEYCGEYGAADIAPDGAVEPFIFRHLVPQWGGGEYLIYTKGIHNSPTATVLMAKPPKGTQTQEPHRAATPHPAMSPGPRSAFREQLNDVRDTISFMQEANGPDEQNQAAAQAATRQQQYDRGRHVGRMEARLEQLEKREREREDRERQDRRGYGYGAGGGLADAGPHMGGPFPGAGPLPGGAPNGPFPTVAMTPVAPPQDELLKLLIDDRRYHRDRGDKLQDEALKRAQAAATAQNGQSSNDSSSAIKMLNDAQIVNDAARKLVGAENDNAAPKSRVDAVLETVAATATEKMTEKMGDWVSSLGDLSQTSSSPGPPKPPGSATPPSSREARAKAKTNRTKARSKKRSKKKRSSNRARAAPNQPSAQPSTPPPPGEPPAFFRAPAQALDKVVADNGTLEELLAALMEALGALTMSSAWAPISQKAMQSLMFDDRNATLETLGEMFGPLVEGGHLREATVRRVLHDGYEQWGEVREQLIAEFQKRQAG